MILEAAFRVETIRNFTIICKFFNRVLRIVIVPRYAIMCQEREELMPIFLKAILVRSSDLRLISPAEGGFEELIDIFLKNAEMPLTQSVLVNRCDDSPQESTELGGEGLEFFIEGVPDDVTVKVPHEMD